MPWKTVPNILPDYDDLSGDVRYDLAEGHGIDGYRTKKSGTHYKKIHVDSRDELITVLNFFGLSFWWKKLSPQKGFRAHIWGDMWVEKKSE